MPSEQKNAPCLFRGLAFVCPRCHEYASVSFTRNIWSVRALCLPYFLCGECRLAHIDLALIDDAVKHWHKGERRFFLDTSLSYWQRRARKFMREVIRKYHIGIGYRFLRRFDRKRLPRRKTD